MLYNIEFDFLKLDGEKKQLFSCLVLLVFLDSTDDEQLLFLVADLRDTNLHFVAFITI